MKFEGYIAGHHGEDRTCIFIVSTRAQSSDTCDVSTFDRSGQNIGQEASRHVGQVLYKA